MSVWLGEMLMTDLLEMRVQQDVLLLRVVALLKGISKCSPSGRRQPLPSWGVSFWG